MKKSSSLLLTMLIVVFFCPILAAQPIYNADFDADPLAGWAPLEMTFTDQSTGPNLVAWDWSFGDGGTSNLQNSSHTYTTEGSYACTLVAYFITEFGLVLDTAAATITVHAAPNNDTTAPEITCPGDVTIDCTASVDPANTGSATATDDWDPNPSISYSDEVTGNCPQDIVITRTWTATDANGNSASCVQTITVIDDAAPVLTGCPGDVTVECDAIPDPAQVTATDNCDQSVDVIFDEVGDLTGCGDYTGTITRTWTATDDCGNESSCTQIITVVDNTDPVLAGCPEDITIECSDQIPDPAQVTATDNCDQSVEVIFNEVSDLTGCGNYTGTITRTWTATDDCGNEVSCTQTISITEENLPPTIACPNDTTVYVGQEGVLNVSATDSDGDAITLSAEDADGSPLPGNVVFVDNGDSTGTLTVNAACIDIGLHTVRFIASDGEFADTCYFNVTVSDTDSDGDGVPGCNDNCPDASNPGQEDLDDDGIGDACDPDGDGDGVDEDGDGSGTPGDNPCTGGATENCDDNCPGLSNPGQEDNDSDGVGNDCDNCPETANPLQNNNDGDEWGDACDDDDDNDGIPDTEDNCPFISNLAQGDADEDGIGDICDNCPNEYNPGQEDIDGDGLGDACDDCQCGVWGDLDGGSNIDPIDVAYLVNYVYKQLDALVDPPDCPFPTGDVNCDGEVDPLDVTYLVNYVYKSLDAICDGCSE